MLPIERLLKVDSASPDYLDGDKRSMFYVESWAMTHYLIAGDRIQGTHRMHDYCNLLVRGVNSVTAAQQAFGDLQQLQLGLKEYVVHKQFMYFMLPVQATSRDLEPEVRPISSAQAASVRANILAYTPRTEQARELLRSVLTEDGNNELAHETMGYLAYRAGEIDDAARWFDGAVGLDPHSYLAHYYSAVVAIARGRAEQDSAIEPSLRMAIRLNPQFAPACDELAMFFAIHHRNLDEAAELSLRATRLEPGRIVYRLNHAEVLAQRRQFAEALDVLQVAMLMAKSPHEVQAVAARAARIEQFQSAMLASADSGSMAGYPR